jgi:hypothetical protein
MGFEIKAAARKWFDQGFNIVPIIFEAGENGKWSKIPLCREWGQWRGRRQTVEEFEALDWDRAEGFAIVCDWPNNEGLYLGVIDFDTKNTTPEAQQRGKELLKRLPITRIEQTISGGLHYVYLSCVKPDRVGEFHDTYALELIGGATLCVMAPSRGYRALNDNPPTIIEDLEGLFYQILGVEDPRKREAGEFPKEFLQKLLEQLMPALRKNVVRESQKWIYLHCPFHPPDNHPSFAINKEWFYARDFHESGKKYSLKQLAEKLGVKLNGGVKLEYVGDKRWKVTVFGKTYPAIKIRSGEDLLTKAKFEWIRRRLSEEELLDIAREIDETYEKEAANAEECERTFSTVQPSWRSNIELMQAAREYVTQKLNEFAQMPYPQNLYAYERWLHDEVLANILCRERINKMLGYIVIVFGEGFILLIPGRSSIGKTTLVDSFIAMREHYMTTRVTDKAIQYFAPEEVWDKILYIRDAPSLEGGVAIVLKALEDTDQGIAFKVDYPVQDPRSGKITTVHSAIRLKAFVSTTNVLTIDTPGLLERKYILQMDDSPEQNKAVLEFIDRMRQQEEEKKIGLRKWTDREWCLALADNLQQILKEKDPGEEILLPYDNLASVALKDLVNDAEVRRNARRIAQFLRWWAKAHWPFLPVYEINGKRYRVITPEAAKIALEYFYALLEAKREFKQPAALKFARKLVEACREMIEEDSERPVIEITKTMRETLAQRLVYSRDSITRYLNGLAIDAAQAVWKEGKGREVVHRIDLKALEDWIAENSMATSLTLTEEQMRALSESFAQTLERWGAKKILCETPLFHPTSIKPEEGLFLEKEAGESGKRDFPPFSGFSGEKEPSPGFSAEAAVEPAPAPLAGAKALETGAEVENLGKGSVSQEKLEKSGKPDFPLSLDFFFEKEPENGRTDLGWKGGVAPKISQAKGIEVGEGVAQPEPPHINTEAEEAEELGLEEAWVEGFEEAENLEAEELEAEVEVGAEEAEGVEAGEPAVEYTGPICEECIHWAALKCGKHPDWIVVTPTARYARSCEYFASKKGEGAGHAKQGAAL